MKDAVAALLAPPCRAFVRYGFPRPARAFVWEHLCAGRVARRPRPFVARTCFGDRIQGDSEDFVAQFVYYFGVWEPNISFWVWDRLQPGRVFCDVGANLGWYSILAARRVGPDGGVVAIEASRRLIPQLERNLALNRTTNVRVVPMAAWCREEDLDLFDGPAGNSGGTTVKATLASRWGAAPMARVTARPLGALLRADEVGRMRLVKIDVEGAESEVIEGLRPLLSAFPADVEFIVEVSPDQLTARGRDVPALLAPFLDLGFHVYRIANDYSAQRYLDYASRRTLGRPERLRGDVNRLQGQSDLVLSRCDAAVL